MIIALFCRVDEVLGGGPQHPQAKLYPGETVTLALLYAPKGSGERAFYRWLTRDHAALFPALPERTRLFRLFAAHRAWADRFPAEPTVLGIADSSGVELRHPRRHGRTSTQLGKKGLSNRRWIAGGKRCVVVNQWGRVVAWDDATANVHDSAFHPPIARYDGRSVLLADGNSHRKAGDPPNLQVCPRGTWPQRILVETVFSLLTRVRQRKRAGHRPWAGCQAQLAFALAAFNLLADWEGLREGEHGRTHLTLASSACELAPVVRLRACPIAHHSAKIPYLLNNRGPTGRPHRGSDLPGCESPTERSPAGVSSMRVGPDGGPVSSPPAPRAVARAQVAVQAAGDRCGQLPLSDLYNDERTLYDKKRP